MKDLNAKRLQEVKEKYLNKDFYIMIQHSSYHGDIIFPVGTIVDVYAGWMNGIYLKWKKKYKLPCNVNDHYEFSESDNFKLFETEKIAKEYYHNYL